MNDIIPFTAAGNLTRDPELRSTSGGDVAHLSLAITPQHKDAKSGEWEHGATTFLDASVWGVCAHHVLSLSKGDRVIVLGRLVTRVFKPVSGESAGKDVRKLEVVVDEIGPSLRWATAVVTKTTAEQPSKPDEEPF